MPIEECPHCFTKVLYGTGTICSACQKDKNSPAEMSKSEYEKKCADENYKAVIDNLTRRCRFLFIAAILLTLGYIISLIASLYTGYSFGIFSYFFWFSIGGFIGGFKDLYSIMKHRKEKAYLSKE